MSQKQPQILLVCSAIAWLSLGCGSDPVASPNVAKAPLQPAAPVVASADAAGAKKEKRSPTAGSIHIEDRILKACGDIPRARFAFDSTEVDPETSRALVALARCFTTGPLAGKGMKLVGHADPRGETEYNFGLGQKRAGSIADYLGKKGVSSEHVETSSRGELEAEGIDEEGWADDRKVDVFLAE